MYLPKRKTQKRKADAQDEKEAHAMTKNYNVSGEKRKELVKKVAEFTGEKEKYLGIPTYSYQSGAFNIGRNGELSWEPEANENAKKLVFWLKIAGFTAEGDEETEDPAEQPAEVEQAEPVVEIVAQGAGTEETAAQPAATEVPAETEAEESADTPVNNNAEAGDGVTDLADASAETEDTSTEDSEETDEDPKEIVEPATENASQEEITDSDAEAEAEETADETSPDKEDDPDTDVEETADEALHATAELDTLSISMPDDLTDTQRANLIKLVRSKETLLKHAFRTDSVEIHMEDEKLIFPWFSASDGDHTNAYILFLTKLISFAKEAKRVTGSDYPVENEKYAMRTWLLRLGMIGPEYKGCRKVLLENLSGNGAFRDGHKKSGAENSEEA